MATASTASSIPFSSEERALALRSLDLLRASVLRAKKATSNPAIATAYDGELVQIELLSSKFRTA